jgi:hypothetical protein
MRETNFTLKMVTGSRTDTIATPVSLRDKTDTIVVSLRGRETPHVNAACTPTYKSFSKIFFFGFFWGFSFEEQKLSGMRQILSSYPFSQGQDRYYR